MIPVLKDAGESATNFGQLVIAATQIGVQLHLITSATSAALVAAGLLSVVIYPLIALVLIPGFKGVEKIEEEEPAPFIESM